MTVAITTLAEYLGREPTLDEFRACNFGWQEGAEAMLKRKWKSIRFEQAHIGELRSYGDDPTQMYSDMSDTSQTSNAEGA